MTKLLGVCTAAAVLVFSLGSAPIHAARRVPTLAVTMTNDPVSNQILVYDANPGVLLQTLSTKGKGGVGGNANGVKAFGGELVAAVNNGSATVAIYRRTGSGLKFDRLVQTSSAPVSIDFGNDHMYVAGATTIDSFEMNRHSVIWKDGTAELSLAEGGAPPDGSTAQVGVVDERTVLVTLKSDPTPGTVDVVKLRNGAVTGAAPTAVSAPAGTLTPFGFSVYPDGTAVITLAHSNQEGLFRDGAFVSVLNAGQSAPCWTTRAGKYVFSTNTASRTISRLVGTGSHIFVDSLVAATIATGGPTDMDNDDSVLGVIDHGAGQSHLSLYALNQFGELSATLSPINLGTSNANGFALMSPTGDDED